MWVRLSSRAGHAPAPRQCVGILECTFAPLKTAKALLLCLWLGPTIGSSLPGPGTASRRSSTIGHAWVESQGSRYTNSTSLRVRPRLGEMSLVNNTRRPSQHDKQADEGPPLKQTIV